MAGVTDDDQYGFFALTRRGRPWFSRPAEILEPLPRPRLAEAVSGRPMLLERGREAPELADYPFRQQRHPRTAVGLSRDGGTLYLVAVDGRQAHSKGMSVVRLARLAREIGAWTAINLDGGGSTALWVGAEGGLVNVPCRGERVVLNHLCVTQAKGPTPKADPEPDAGVHAATAPVRLAPHRPAPPRLRPVLLREMWAPLAFALAATLAVLAVRRIARGARPW